MSLTLFQKTVIELVGIFFVILLLFGVGTVTYHNLENWTYTDSFYFTGITLTTIGYGDLHPTTNASKIFTVFFALAGICALLGILTIISQYFFSRQKAFGQRAGKDIAKHVSNMKEKRNKKFEKLKYKFIRKD